MPTNKDTDTESDEAARLAILFEDIRLEIRLLDQLDLTDVHPAVVFNPMLGQDEANE